MTIPRPRRPSPALIVASLALFVALGGPAQAGRLIHGKDIRRDTVGSRQLKDRGVRERDLGRGLVRVLQATPPASIGPEELRDGSVGAADLIAGSVTAAAIAGSAVGGFAIADGSVDTPDLANHAVRTGKIANGGVRKADLARDAVGTEEVADRSLTLADSADFSGSGTVTAEEPLAPGACLETDSVVVPAPAEGETVLDDLVVAGRGAGWPAALALRAQPQDAATVRIAVCNTGTVPETVSGLAFRYVTLD